MARTVHKMRRTVDKMARTVRKMTYIVTGAIPPAHPMTPPADRATSPLRRMPTTATAHAISETQANTPAAHPPGAAPHGRKTTLPFTPTGTLHRPRRPEDWIPVEAGPAPRPTRAVPQS